jgi:DNA primase
MRIPVHDFERTKRAILDRVDISSLVSEHVSLKRRGRRLVGLCPFHSEKTPSFTVSPELGLFKCFGCGKGGDIFTFVQARENVSFPEAAQILADRAGVELQQAGRRDDRGPSRQDVAKVNAWAERYFRKNLEHPTVGKPIRAYVADRGFSDETAERFGLGLACDAAPVLADTAKRAGIGMDLLIAADLVRTSEQGQLYDTFRDRLMFPIRDVTRRVIGFGGRTLVGADAKYLNTRQNALFDKGRSLYGLDLARDAIVQRGRAVVVEGYTDCIAAQQAGFTETVATLGTALTEAHVDVLRRYTDLVVLLFDSDDAGEAAADRAIRVALPRCIQCRLARLPEAKDPSEFLAQAGPDAFSDVLKRAVDALEFKWSQARERFAADSSDARRREALLDFLRLVAEAVNTQAIDAIQRGLVVNQVAHLVRMDRAEVDRMIARLQRRKVEPGAARGPSRAPRPHDAPDREQAAWVNLLEVAMAEPAVVSAASELPDPGRVVDPVNRRIAMVVMELARSKHGFALADVLARISDVPQTERITELSHRGLLRGNYDVRLTSALADIERARRSDESENDRRALMEAPTADEASGPDRDRLVRFADGRRENRGFSPPRLVRQAHAGEVARQSPAPEPAVTEGS